MIHNARRILFTLSREYARKVAAANPPAVVNEDAYGWWEVWQLGLEPQPLNRVLDTQPSLP